MSEARRTPAGPSELMPAPELVDAGFAVEIADAPLLHEGLNLADMAHVLDLRARGLIPEDSLSQLLRVLLAAHETTAEDFPYDPQYGETYNCRERYFSEEIGDAAGWLHAGRPRREAARVALRLLLRRMVAELVIALSDFSDATASLARKHADTYMPDQTYLQQAQPSTFGHYVLGFTHPALRDARRLLSELELVNLSPGGAGCVNGTRLLEDRGQIADLLAFSGIIEHTRDAMWQTDGLVQLLAITASLISNQSKLAEDLEIWNSREFDFVDLAGPYTRSSILMPQKRNPYALSIVRGASGVLIGRLSGFLSVVKSPSARSDNYIYAYGEVPRAIETAQNITRLMSGVVSTLVVNEERMWEQLVDGFSQSTDLAEHVMLEGAVDYRTAYQVVGATLREASRRGLRGVDITGKMIDDAAAELLGRPLGFESRDLSDVLDPRSIVGTRRAKGGAAPAVVSQMAESARSDAAALRDEATAHLDAFRAAEADVVGRVRELSRG